MKVLEIVFIVLAVGLIAFNSFFIWSNYISPKKINLSSYASAPLQKPVVYEAKQFYPNMRYPNREISFSIESYCNPEKRRNILSALKILGDLTILRFYESNENSEIKFICSSAPEETNSPYLVVGEGGPTKIINTTSYNIILEGKIFLYKEEKCPTPVITLHEILHAFGFEHSNDENNVLFPVTNCEQTIDSEVIKTINNIYSTESLPDIAIEFANATIIGNYLSFSLIIANLGLKESSDATIIVLSNEKEIKKIPLEPIELGKKRIFTAKNIPVFKKTNEITFFIESKEDELSKENNKATLFTE